MVRTFLSALLGRDVRRLLLLTMLPVVVCGLAMKMIRVSEQALPITWWRVALCIAPDVLYFVGFAALIVALFAITRGKWLRALAVALTQVIAIVTFAVDSLAFGYQRATGLVLDYAMFAFSLSRVEETAPVVGSQITWATATLLIVVPLWLLIAPWAFPGARRVVSEPAPALGLARWISPPVLLSVGAACLIASYRVAITDVPVSLLRDPVVHLTSGYVEHAQGGKAVENLVPPRRTGPKRLVATDDTKKLNVVVIILESTRADATTAYVPKLKTTPFLAELAKTGTRVNRAYAIVPHTSKALVAILCGIEPRPSLEIVEAAKDGMPARCLAKLLAGVGYDTAFFQAPKSTFEHRPQLTKNMGYAKFLSGDKMESDGFDRVNYFGFEDAIMLPPSEQWLKNEAREPFFATYLTSASHHAYGVPKAFEKQQFSRDNKNNYLNAVHYVDSVVEKIVAQYKAAGLYDRTMFVIVGDHGEGFGEHRLSTHDDVVYEEGLRIPMVFRVPGRTDLPREVPGPLNQLSIAPTILSMLGLRGVGGRYEGESIFTASNRALHATCYRNSQCMAVVSDNMKMLYFFDDKPTLLFDLSRDPGEKKNIAARHPDLVKKWTEDLKRWTLAVDAAHMGHSDALLADLVRTTPSKKFKRPMNARFGNQLELLGCSGRRRRGGIILVSCEFHTLAALPDHTRIRVHATAEGNTQIYDHKTLRGMYAPREWKPGEYVTDTFEIRAPGRWQNDDVALCLEVDAGDGTSLAITPANADGLPCIELADVPARTPPPPRPAPAKQAATP